MWLTAQISLRTPWHLLPERNKRLPFQSMNLRLSSRVWALWNCPYLQSVCSHNRLCINLCLKSNKGQKPYKNMKLRKIRHRTHSPVSPQKPQWMSPQADSGFDGLHLCSESPGRDQAYPCSCVSSELAVPHRAGAGTADQPCHHAVVTPNANEPCCALGENGSLVLLLPTIQQGTKQAFRAGGSFSNLLFSPSQFVLLHSSCSEPLQTSPLK